MIPILATNSFYILLEKKNNACLYKKIGIPKCHVAKKRYTDLQFLRGETHLQQRDLQDCNGSVIHLQQIGRSLNRNNHHNHVIQAFVET